MRLESPEERSKPMILVTITVAKSFIGMLGETRRANVTNLAYDQHAIPKVDALDKLLRYEAPLIAISLVLWIASSGCSVNVTEKQIFQPSIIGRDRNS